MPAITVEGLATFEAASTTRLVKAIEGNGIDILHRCGGNARCTTCRVEFIAGEPRQMTKAEHERLVARELLGQVRLSCQILCDHDMHVRVVNRLSATDLSDAGPEPDDKITPEPEWIERPS
jgi:ferredoxin